MAIDQTTQSRIEALIERTEEQGEHCINLSDLAEIIQEADVGEDDIQRVHDDIEARGIELSDDCARAGAEPTTRVAGNELAGVTTDALQLFLNEIRRYPLLTAADEVRLAKRIEQGDSRPRSR